MLISVYIQLLQGKHIHVDNSTIQQNKSAKYLGITITDKLSWSEHIINITNKANSIRALLQRNLSRCQPSVKAATYVCPILEYASTIWSPHLACDMNTIKMAQRQSTRFVQNDFRRTSSVTRMLNNLQWPTSETRRHHVKVLMLYKILNNIITVPHDHLTRSALPTRGHDYRFIQLTERKNTYVNSFFPSTVRLWNTLPSYVMDSSILK